MYDGPNYNPDSVQRHAPGQPPWVQAQAKVEHDAAAWTAAQQQSPSEPLTEDDLRSLMATGVFFVLGGGWLARYFRNRILRGPTSRLPRPVQASTTQGGVAEALRQITSPVTPGCGFPDNCSGSLLPA